MFYLFATLAFSAFTTSPAEEKSFLSWMRRTKNFYTGDEYFVRFGIYLSNQKLVREHNTNPNNKFKLAMNHLSTLTPSEYQTMLGFKPLAAGNLKHAQKIPTMRRNEDEVDWRTKGAVNPVKNQGSCGSCWAFSAIQNCESAEFLTYNTLYTFSEQLLVDCDTTDSGCHGGFPANAYEFILNHWGGKVMLDSDYPYKAVEGTCLYDKKKAIGHFTKYIQVKENDESDLAATCAQYGPVSIGIDASQYSFQLYSGGIYDEPHCNIFMLNHGVGLVGYGAEDGVQYWIVRNSWGETWGEEGYIRMIRGSNQCGEATFATCIISE